ncbi:MAG: hypothetical protein E7439_05035 [Ruminococcaceae bacterium]|nr:hypothetical protein [Oscillospiraceae bacterium]
MNTTQLGVLTLLRSAVTCQSLPVPEGFSLEEAMPLIRGHHMITAIYDGAVRCGIDRKNPAMQRLFAGYVKALQVSEGQMAELARLFEAFEAEGIEYMPLKGSRIKYLYPKPELRMMGDADVLIRLEQYGKIIGIMRALGYADKGESDHELIWQNPGLYLELHKRVIPSYNEDYHAYFGDGWQLAKVKDGCRWSMTPEDEMVYLFTHFAKHYRDGGIGCRHILDLWVYLRANPKLDHSYVMAELEKLQIATFYQYIRELIAYWFEDGQGDERLEFMSDYVFASGSWGKMEDRIRSITLREEKRSALGLKGKFAYGWKLMFPSAKVLERKYTILQKAPWTLPAVWLVRPFYKALFERKSLEEKKQEMDALDKDALESHEQMLKYMGLEYHF